MPLLLTLEELVTIKEMMESDFRGYVTKGNEAILPCSLEHLCKALKLPCCEEVQIAHEEITDTNPNTVHKRPSRLLYLAAKF